MNGPGLAGRPNFVGARVARVEDDRLVTGRGTFVADLDLPGMVEMAVLRSQVAHARLNEIRADAARQRSGVVAVVTGADLADVKPFPDFFDYVRPVAAFPLCRDRVRYVGAPLAAVVAESRYAAEDALEALDVDYVELPGLGSVEAALAADAPTLYDGWPDNRMMDVPGSNPAVAEAFASAPRIVRGRYSVQRHAAVPLETRGSVAEFRHGRLTLWTGQQSPHIARTMLSYVLPIPERDIRVVVPDVGGAFGCKCHVYTEDVLVCWLAMRLGRPVRWVEDRAEHLVSTVHSREHVIELEAAVGDDGRIRAIRSHVTQDVGAEDNVWFSGINVSFVSAGHVTGPYRIQHAENHVTCVVTNKTPAGAFRGFGIPEMVFAVERLMDRIAAETGVDRFDLRRSILIGDDELPYVTATGGVYDSGSFRRAFERCLTLALPSFESARARFAADPSARVGLGLATYAEGTAPTYFGTTGHWTAHDAASIRVEPDGSVVVSVGVTTTGQGTTTMVATLAADALGVDRDRIKVQIGDTDTCPYGLGGWGSRSAVIGGGAVLKAAAEIRRKILRIAGHLLETDPEDLLIEDGSIHVTGSDRPSVSIAEVATAAIVRTVDLPPDIERGLDATATYEPPGLEHRPDQLGRINGAAAWANATHAAVVKVDLETGEVEILDYLVTHDCGPIINPPIVDGQVIGGVAQGIGGTLYEHLAYNDEGQPVAASFMDYLIPTATEIPTMRLEHFETPSPNMPLGVKGVGEGGVIGVPGAVGNAITDALSEFRIEADSTPYSPALIRARIREASKRRAL